MQRFNSRTWNGNCGYDRIVQHEEVNCHGISQHFDWVERSWSRVSRTCLDAGQSFGGADLSSKIVEAVLKGCTRRCGVECDGSRECTTSSSKSTWFGAWWSTPSVWTTRWWTRVQSSSWWIGSWGRRMVYGTMSWLWKQGKIFRTWPSRFRNGGYRDRQTANLNPEVEEICLI